MNGLNVRNRSVLDRVVKICGKVVGNNQKSMNEMFECYAVRKASLIVSERSHVLAAQYELLPSARRFKNVKCRTVRARSSFVPESVRMLNDGMKGKRKGECQNKSSV